VDASRVRQFRLYWCAHPGPWGWETAWPAAGPGAAGAAGAAAAAAGAAAAACAEAGTRAGAAAAAGCAGGGAAAAAAGPPASAAAAAAPRPAPGCSPCPCRGAAGTSPCTALPAVRRQMLIASEHARKGAVLLCCNREPLRLAGQIDGTWLLKPFCLPRSDWALPIIRRHAAAGGSTTRPAPPQRAQLWRGHVQRDLTCSSQPQLRAQDRWKEERQKRLRQPSVAPLPPHSRHFILRPRRTASGTI
jgi:hypothetical protein